MKKSFYEALCATIPAEKIVNKCGLSYLSAATAMALASRPEVEFVDFSSQPHLACLNGALVAVDLAVPGTSVVQRMWLPVMDSDWRAIATDKLSVRDVNDSRQRCLVKGIAAVFGDGMSLYLGCDGDGSKAAKMLGVTPDTDLATVTPLVANLKEGGAPYVEWGVAVAACRITDPKFSWGVVLWDGLPYREALNGVMVDVDTVYRGKAQRLSLPIMDSAFNAIPADKASVFDWNKAVMRALTKCIAYNTGYGLGVYADEYGTSTKSGTVVVDEAAKFDESKPAEAKPAKPMKAKSAKALEAILEAVALEVKEAAGGTKDVVQAAEPPVAPADVRASVAAKVEETPSAAIATEVSIPNDAAARFKAVMQKRRADAGVPGVISLFKALADSTKYTEEEKPVCFSVLVSAAVALVTTAEIGSLLANLKTYNAMQYVAADSREMLAGKLTATALAAGCAVGDADLVQAASNLVEAGVAATMADVLQLAVTNKVPGETLDLLQSLLDTTAVK